jgi:hypothetical protein
MDYSDLSKEHADAYLNLDKEKIADFCRKYRRPIPVDEEVFWAAAHKVRLFLKSASTEQKEQSRRWLLARGFTPGIGTCFPVL